MRTSFITAAAAVSLLAIAISSATAQVAASKQYAQLTQSSDQDVLKLDMAAVPDLDRDSVRKVQRALEEKGFDPGAIDGAVGPSTIEAIVKFQDRFGIKANGELNNQTLFALGIVGETPSQTGTEPVAKSAPEPQKPAAKSEPEPQKKPRRKPDRASKEKTPPKKSRRNTAERKKPKGNRYSWCAVYDNGRTECTFETFKQCRATISGIGGFCQQQ
jgi:peptidoglycan hydrolase-like protein with peptidoglycan-binding domain